ncbi:MAG: glycosyltransferase family A protein [Verrucomicrobiota bacterium]
MSDAAFQPLVSIVIPSFNQARYVGEAIQSALRQTWPNTEIIVADDCSPDNSWEIIRRAPGSVVKIRREKNLGFAANANDLFQRAKGDYICLLCSDDVLEPNFVESAMVLFSERTDLGYVQVHYQPIDENGRPMTPVPAFYSDAGIIPGMEETRISLLGCHTMLSHHVFSARAFREAGGFSTFSGMAYDYELAINISSKFDTGYVPQPLVRWRYSELHQTHYNRTSMLTVFDQYRVRLQTLDRRLPKDHPIQKLRPKIIAAAAKEAMTYGRWAMDAGDYATARKYLGLMIAFDYHALNSPAFENTFQALSSMLKKSDAEITHDWAEWVAQENSEAGLNQDKQGAPYPLPPGSTVVSAEKFPRAGLRATP